MVTGGEDRSLHTGVLCPHQYTEQQTPADTRRCHVGRLQGVVIDYRHVRSGVGLLYVVIDCGVFIKGVSSKGTRGTA